MSQDIQSCLVRELGFLKYATLRTFSIQYLRKHVEITNEILGKSAIIKLTLQHC